MGCLCSSGLEPQNLYQVDISHFEILKVVGKGGFGKVNVVRHRDTGDFLAMKRMKKAELVKKKMYVITAWRERSVMCQCDNPFLLKLLYAFQDEAHLILVMPFYRGGDLRFYLRSHGRMEENLCKFYAAEILLGLEDLHNKHIIYRDMKPDNLLIDETGHLSISDFGLAIILKEESGYLTKGGAGTQGYQAPEIIQKQQYGVACDHWSFGVTIYELLHAARPFSRTEKHESDLKIRFRPGLSQELHSFLTGLLVRDATQRLGVTSDGLADWAQVRKHPWFAGIDWDKVRKKEMKPLWIPEPDKAHFSPDHELQEQFFGDTEKEIKQVKALTPTEQSYFKGYEFNTAYTPPPHIALKFAKIGKLPKKPEVHPPVAIKADAELQELKQFSPSDFQFSQVAESTSATTFTFVDDDGMSRSRAGSGGGSVSGRPARGISVAVSAPYGMKPKSKPSSATSLDVSLSGNSPLTTPRSTTRELKSEGGSPANSLATNTLAGDADLSQRPQSLKEILTTIINDASASSKPMPELDASAVSLIPSPLSVGSGSTQTTADYDLSLNPSTSLGKPMESDNSALSLIPTPVSVTSIENPPI